MDDVRLIDANAIVKTIKSVRCKDCDSYNGVLCRDCQWMDAMDYIEDAPTVDAQPVKRGKWEDREVRGSIVPYCSNCGNGIDSIYHYDWCPNCGAYMK